MTVNDVRKRLISVLSFYDGLPLTGKELIGELNASGIQPVTRESFDIAMYRLRKENVPVVRTKEGYQLVSGVKREG